MDPETSGIKRNPDGTFPKGVSGNPAGRPVGTVSPITMLRQMFEENPDDFKAFVKRYKENPMNEKHVVEMLDGKPEQKTDITSNGETLTPLLVKFLDNDTDNGNTEGV